MHGMKDLELESYIVFAEPLEMEGVRAVLDELGDMAHELYPTEMPDLIRAVRVTGDQEAGMVLEILRARLVENELRWLEIGLRGYGLIKGKREYKPWRRNAYLNLEAFKNLQKFEPEVRYHTPS